MPKKCCERTRRKKVEIFLGTQQLEDPTLLEQLSTLTDDDEGPIVKKPYIGKLILRS